jgi:4'-phosphopantetheinyl transferase
VSADRVEVWLIRADLPGPDAARLERLLDPGELARAASYDQGSDRRCYIAAHGAARVIIGGQLGVPPGQLSWRYGPQGKPELAGAQAGLQVSLSHSGDLAALALARTRRVGVDVQVLPAAADAIRMARRFYPRAETDLILAAAGPGEQAACFTRLWVRKEACVKVTGGRLMPGLQLAVAGPDPVLVSDPGGPVPGSYLVRDVAAPEGYRAAVAAEGARPYQVSARWWAGE